MEPELFLFALFEIWGLNIDTAFLNLFLMEPLYTDGCVGTINYM